MQCLGFHHVYKGIVSHKLTFTFEHCHFEHTYVMDYNWLASSLPDISKIKINKQINK